jgi:hypothetical protein
MSFLFPAMLAGLAALSIPVVLHLIARQKFPVLDFPTIRLLEGERRTNTLAMRLVDVGQLLLRLLVLALIIVRAVAVEPAGDTQPRDRPRRLGRDDANDRSTQRQGKNHRFRSGQTTGDGVAQ